MAEKYINYKLDYSPEMKAVRAAINKFNKDYTRAGKIVGDWNPQESNIMFAKAINNVLLMDLIQLGDLIDTLIFPKEGKAKAIVGFTNPETKEKTVL